MNRKKLDIEKELSIQNLNRFIEGLQLVLASSEQLSEKASFQFRANLEEMEGLARYIGRQSKHHFDKNMMLWILSTREFVNVLMSMEPMKPYLSRLLKIRENLSKFTSQFNIKLFEDTDINEDTLSENLEGKSIEEKYNYFVKDEISKIKEYYDKKELDGLKERAKEDALTYIYSHGEVKPVAPKNLEQELYEGVKAFHDEWKKKTNYVIRLNQESLSEEDLSDSQKLEKYLGQVSDFVIESERKKRKTK